DRKRAIASIPLRAANKFAPHSYEGERCRSPAGDAGWLETAAMTRRNGPPAIPRRVKDWTERKRRPGNTGETMIAKRLAPLGALACTLGLLAIAPAGAHGPNQPPHQLYKIGDFKLESGETIKDFSISYVTHGTLNAKKSNAILMVTAISGNHHRLDFMIGPGKALDPTKYFIICTDAIGNGLTTSPSNSTAQPHMKFPKFLIRDMVESEYKLATEHFGLTHVVAVIGPSMGGMQTLQWGVSHPDFMDSLVAIVPLAKTPAWTVSVLEASRKAIMLDPAWKGGEYTTQPE